MLLEKLAAIGATRWRPRIKKWHSGAAISWCQRQTQRERPARLRVIATRPRALLTRSNRLLATLPCALLTFNNIRGAELTASVQDVMIQRVRPCIVCHGKEGRATPEGYYPRIAGKPARYLLNEMINFRVGRRGFPEMVYLMQLRNDTDLAEVAAFFAGQRVPYASPVPPEVSPQVLERGRKLVFDGNTTLHIPACRSCHGSRLLGVEPAVPGLLGVSADYLAAQLGAWRGGTRAAQPPDCMAVIARRLRPEDIAAVTVWLASQAAPPGAVPAESFDSSPPIDCGSILSAQKSVDTSSSPPETTPRSE